MSAFLHHKYSAVHCTKMTPIRVYPRQVCYYHTHCSCAFSDTRAGPLKVISLRSVTRATAFAAQASRDIFTAKLWIPTSTSTQARSWLLAMITSTHAGHSKTKPREPRMVCFVQRLVAKCALCIAACDILISRNLR